VEFFQQAKRARHPNAPLLFHRKTGLQKLKCACKWIQRFTVEKVCAAAAECDSTG
jgi:hypothetical protein